MMRLLAALLLALTLAAPAAAQERSQLGLAVETQEYPHAGLLWHAGDRVALRFMIHLGGVGDSFSDALDRTVLNVAGVYRWTVEPALSVYAGPEATSAGDYRLYLGGLAGAQYQLSDRFGVFGEVGLSLVTIGDAGPDRVRDDLNMFSTGVGAVLYLR